MNPTGEERRVHQDEQLGYIRGKLESLEAELSGHMEREEENDKLLRQELEALKEQLNVYRFVWASVRVFAAAVFASMIAYGHDIIQLFKG